MTTISKEKLKIVKECYDNGASAREIAEKFNVSIDAVYYYFRKYNIKRRSAGENNRLQFKKKPPSFSIRSNLTAKEKGIKIAGIMLYWAEGSKWPGEKIVDFANSDPEMIKIFLIFLRRICGIKEDKLRIYLYCYKNQSPKDLMTYWSRITNIPISQFTKPYIRKDYKIIKESKMKKGLIHIRYNDKKLLLLIKKWISDYIRTI